MYFNLILYDIYKRFKNGLVIFWLVFLFWDYNVEKFRFIYERYSNGRGKRLKLLVINWFIIYIWISCISLCKTMGLFGGYWKFDFFLNVFLCKFYVYFI